MATTLFSGLPPVPMLSIRGSYLAACYMANPAYIRACVIIFTLRLQVRQFVVCTVPALSNLSMHLAELWGAEAAP